MVCIKDEHARNVFLTATVRISDDAENRFIQKYKRIIIRLGVVN